MALGCCKPRCPPGPEGPAGPAGSDGTTLIESQSDFPEPVNGTITLEGDTTYTIAGAVAIDPGVQVQMVAGSCLKGNGKHCSRLVGDTDGSNAFIIGPVGGDVYIEGLTIVNNGTGPVIFHDGSLSGEIELINVVIDGSNTSVGISVTNETRIELHNVEIINVTIGLLVGGGGIPDVIIEGVLFDTVVNAAIDIDANIDILSVQAQFNNVGDGIDLNSAITVNDLQVFGSYFDNPTVVAIDFNASTVVKGTITSTIFDVVGIGLRSTGVSVVSGITVTANTFVGSGTFLDGIFVCDINWEFSANTNVENTHPQAQLVITAPIAPIVAGPLGVQVAGSSTILAVGTCKFSNSVGSLRYNGNKPVTVQVVAVLSATVGTGDDVEAQILLNGALVANTDVKVRVLTTRTLITVTAVLKLQKNNTVDVNVDTALASLENYQLSVAA